MKRYVLALVSYLLLATSAHAADGTQPSVDGMAKWKKETLSRYEEVIYLETDGKPLTGAMFNQRIVNDKPAFRMTTESTTPKKIVIRILSDAETKQGQTAEK
ncbi:hypothetical protein [Pseudoduganella namucuonensis]|uniref:Uncharacterized protein n=1 Tax=Pseudoduganella namucuonensis TaxID=1035707 RepID=A0A1I7L2F8_9BURK|nr:hypothetical protein [Pseudoduganella namucuonensis]SFV03910.1 hypothetical protein SAMN05216552_102274 [Pseudoduganella namucuonensis]